jgi:hypothetical protein
MRLISVDNDLVQLLILSYFCFFPSHSLSTTQPLNFWFLELIL